MTDHADKASDLTDDLVENATAENIHEFLAKCNGKVRPFFVRPELILVFAHAGEQAANLFGPGVLNAIMYADLWLKNYAGHEHVVKCGCCVQDFTCRPENSHSEVGGFMTMQDDTYDTHLGGMVMPVCVECAAQSEERVYEQFSESIGGTYLPGGSESEVPGPEAPEVTTPKVSGETGTHVLSDETKDIIKGLVGND